MITAFRRYLGTWVVRAFFIVMVLSFVFWGVGDVVRLIGTPTWVAKVGEQTVESATFQAEYQRAVSAAARELPAGQGVTAEMRRRIADETLQRMVGQVVLGAELRALRISTPDAAVADYARAMPAFRGPDGKFSKSQFDAVLRNNGLTEARFLDMLRGDLSQRQLLGAVAAGAGATDTATRPVYEAEFAKRSVDLVEFPFAAAPEPQAPDEAALRRWYDNHPDLYATPEYRRIKAVVLSPQILAKSIEASDDELRSAFEQNRQRHVTEAKRSAEVISVSDEAKARELAEKWRGGADWAAMQEAARGDGAAAVSMEDATQPQFPDPDLARAVFAASVDAVTEPVKGALGWFVVKVTKATSGSDPTFEQARDQVREHLVADKAADLLYDRANKLDNLLGNGTALTDLPGDLGVAAVAGTLDSDGNTADGTPAPIPGGSEVKSAIVSAAFQTQANDPPRLVEVSTPSAGGSAYYALVVEGITPAATEPFDQVQGKVAEDWEQDQRRHAQNAVAARLLAAVKGGQPLADAAAVAGVSLRRSPLVTRNQPAEAMPPALQRLLFGLKKDEATMVETPDSFVVAQLAEVVEPDAKADASGYEQVRAAVSRSLGGDLTNAFTEALRQRANPQINRKNFDQIVQP